MGNKHAADSNDVAKMYSNLINMGFDEKVSMEAANKYPKNVDKAVSFVITLQQKMQSDHQQEMKSNKEYLHINKHSPCEIEKCAALNRLIKTLQIYKIYNNNDNLDNLSEYIHSNKQYIINDYHHILQIHLNQNTISRNKNEGQFKMVYDKLNDNKLLCEVAKCKIFQRNNRERGKQHIFDIKENGNDLLTYIDILDCIHCHFIHSVDTGYEILNDTFIVNNDDNNTTNDGNDNDVNMFHDEELLGLKSYLDSKRKHLETIRGQKRFQTNKFMSQINQRENNKNNKALEAKSNDDYTEMQTESKQENGDNYSFGVRYDYWGHRPHEYDYYDLEPKYCNLKEELISNKVYKISHSAFNQSYERAQQLMLHSNTVKTIRNRDSYAVHFGVPYFSDINIDNVLSIMFYTDYDTLSYNFSASFRKLSKNESDDEIIKRNKEYGNWTKILTETVNCYGSNMEDAPFNVLYHGVSFMYFDSFIAQFDSPISTTTKLSVATIFAKNHGIILELNNEKNNKLKYFNCSFISIFSNESEKLFIQPPRRNEYHLKFVSIRNMSNNENYKKLITLITILTQIINPIKADLKFTNLYFSASTIKGLNDLFMFLLGSNVVHNVYPEYVIESLKKWTNKQKIINIRIDHLEQYAKGINIINRISSNLVQFDKLNVIFKNVKKIKCWNTGKIDESYILSLLLIIDEINRLKHSTLKRIILCQIESDFDLPNDSHYESFATKHWNMEIKYGNNLCLEKCEQ